MRRDLPFEPPATISPPSAEEPAKAETEPRQVRPATAEDVGNQETAERLAVRIWAAVVSRRVLDSMAALFDELIHEKYLIDDDDEEGDDESWVDDQCKRERRVLDEGIKCGFDNYPNIDAINRLPPSDLPKDLVPDAEQLSAVLKKCAIGSTRFEQKPHEQLARLVRIALKERFEKDAKYRVHVREDVPDWTSSRTAAGAAPRPRGRLLGRKALRMAVGWPHCSPADGFAWQRIASILTHGPMSSPPSARPRTSTGATVLSSPSGTADEASWRFPDKHLQGLVSPPSAC